MQTILVIDDDDSLRDTISLMLEQEGFKTVLAADGKIGYQTALGIKPDLLLVDLRLPGMSGIEICKQLRAANVATPIIVLSAMEPSAHRDRMLKAGASAYFQKPADNAQLLAAIRLALGEADPAALSTPRSERN